jgi:hypothetical protein
LRQSTNNKGLKRKKEEEKKRIFWRMVGGIVS